MNFKFRDYRCRPKGSPEVSYDPFIIVQMHNDREATKDPERRHRISQVYRFMIKVALIVLPPKQKRIFYSVWIRSGGRLNKGIMELSRRTGKSHYTAYNNYYKAIHGLLEYLEKSGYTNHLVGYINREYDELLQEQNA